MSFLERSYLGSLLRGVENPLLVDILQCQSAYTSTTRARALHILSSQIFHPDRENVSRGLFVVSTCHSTVIRERVLCPPLLFNC